MASTGSVTELFAHLCDLQTPETKRANLIQPKVDKKQFNTRLKRKLYNTLFTFLKDKDRRLKNTEGHCGKSVQDVKTQIWWHTLRLRRQRKFDDANQLESLFSTLTEDSKDGAIQDDIFSVLQFLLKLKDTGPSVDKEVMGHIEQKLPTLPNRDYLPLLPDGPLCYGDTQLVQPNRFHYMHYPRSLFEGEPLKIVNTVSNICDMLPGTGLSGNGFFNVEGYLCDDHEKSTTESLFGGLVQGRVTSLDIKLDLPELPDDSDSGMLELRIPKSFSSLSMDLNDEGFKSQDESVASTTPDTENVGESSFDSAFHADYDTSIYDDCLTADISQHYTWETIGLGPGARMKPFLTEAGPQAFDHWNQAILTTLKVAFPTIHVAPRVEISQRSLVRDVLNLMIAVPSMNFMLDLTDQCFTMRDGVYVSGMSSEALQNFMDDFLTLGMYYYRLDLFSTAPVLNSFYHAGLTYHAFTGAVQTVLQYYRAAVLSIPVDKTLLQLRVMCHNLLQEMRFLSCLCKCDNPVTEETKDSFPTGVSLLSYVYSQTLEASFSDHYPLMLSLLKHTCTPYLVFVQNWIYHGVFRDNYGEFMIEVHDDFLQFKDKHYWTHGYTLTTTNIEESAPLFLKDLANDVFICGKSINLLKACNRDHFICDVDDNDVPRISLTFSQTELCYLSDQCTLYINKMQQVARQNTLSRQERKKQAERAKQDLIAKARQVATKELQILQDKLKEIKKATDAKKRRDLLFLKTQMETDLKRRAQGRQDAAAADRDLMDRLLRKEEVMGEEELELERQAREEVIAYYSQLSEEAARREQKALWRVRRAKLGLARREFLLHQERQWALEMERSKDDPTVVQTTPVVVSSASSTQTDLPRWAERGLDGPTLEVTEENEGQDGPELEDGTEKSLPKWAVKGLQKYGMSVTGKSPSSVKSTSSTSLGGKTSTRRSLNSSFTVNDETEELPQKASVQTFNHMHATTESKSDQNVDKLQIRLVGDHHATTETIADEVFRPHIKSVGDRHITQQTEAEPESHLHLKTVENRHVNKLSEEPEFDNVPRLKQGNVHASTETQSAEWKIKNQSNFGHVSERSDVQIEKIPKMKRSDTQYANKESLFSTDFGIKPKIRTNRERYANKESEEAPEAKSRIKMNDKMSATKESEYIDWEGKRVQMFRERNVYGHAADSTVQKLLYQQKFDSSDTENDDTDRFLVSDIKVIPSNDQMIWLDNQVEPYTDNFDFLDNPPQSVDLMSSLHAIQYASYGNYVSLHGDVEGYKYLPLPAVMKASITRPLEEQISLVNESIVAYFMGDLQIEQHFKALRRYLCMGNGDFSEILCDLLMEKLGTNPRPQDLVNPMFLNNCLNKAVRLSITADDKYADNLSFVHKYLPKSMEQTSPDVLDCIQLHYEVKWPLNIVITKKSLHKYSQVFSFMLQLKRVVWVLKDVWHKLKRDGIIHKVDRCVEFRQLHLYRQEMQHFVKVMQEYISYQIVDVTWQELQTALSKDVHNLDDLHAAHNHYLDNALFRCLLTKNASSLMKIIQDIFRLILKFHRQLSNGSWQTNTAGVPVHRNYTQMCHTYKVFLEHSGFLFKVVSKLAVRGYEPHLHDLLLRLNFNNYYEK